MTVGSHSVSPFIQSTTGGFNYVAQSLNQFRTVINGTQTDIENFYAALEQEGSGALANYIRTTDTANLSVQGFYNSLNLQTTGFANIRNIIRNYNAITDQTGRTQAAFTNSINQTNIGLGNYLNSVQAGQATMGGYVKSLIATTVKTTALKVASVALNAAISVGTMWLISKGIQALSDWANAEHMAAEAAKESAEDTNKNIDSAKEYADKVVELRKKLDEGNLSTKDAVDTRKQLIELQDNLNDYYGDEIDNVNTLRDSYDKLNGSISEYQSKEAGKWLTDNADIIEKSKEAYTHFGSFDYFENLAQDIQKLKTGSLSIQEYNDIVSKYQNELVANSSKFKKWNGEYADNIEDVLGQQENLAHDLQEYIYDRAVNPNWFEKTGNLASEYVAGKYAFNYGDSEELLEIYSQYGKMLSQYKYGDILSNITEQQNKLNDALSREDSTGIKEAREELEKLSKSIQDYKVIASEDNAARTYLSDLIGDSFKDFDFDTVYNEAIQNVFMAYAKDNDTGYNGELYRNIATRLRDLSIEELTTLSSANISDIKAYGRSVNDAIDSALNQSDISSFNWSEFYDEQGLEDVEKKLKSLKTAYKSLEENGELSKDEQASLLKDYPELLQYIDDPEKLKVAIQSSAREAISAAQLVLTNLYLAAEAGSTEEANLKKALGVLDDMADVTTKVKEKTTKTSDLYKEQKKQIHENIQALNREIQSIDKQVDALEKKKDAQEEYVKQLEKEKDRLDDLIDKYERAADTVSDYIDEQIDGLEKQQDAIEKSYNDQIDALKEYYEEQSDLLSEQIKGLEFDSSSYDSQID